MTNIKSKPHVQLSSVRNADGGLHTKFDAKKNELTIRGTAEGLQTRVPGVKMSEAERKRTPEYERTEEYGGTIGLEFDKNKMPEFDTSNGYTEKNKWYFEHCADVGTHQGESAQQVAESLARRIESSGQYDAKVRKNDDGSVTLSVDWK